MTTRTLPGPATPRRPLLPGLASRSKRLLSAPETLVVAAAVLTRVPGLVRPVFSGDEAVYAALAGRILDGHWPYEGAVDHKPAGIMLAYAGIFAATAPWSLLAVRSVLIAVVA